MIEKNSENVENVIKDVVAEHQLDVQPCDIPAIKDAYLKRGDINLALTGQGEIVSDVMEAEELDVLSNALEDNFGQQNQNIPFQIYPVKIRNKTYETYVDEHGNQRFVGNPIIEVMVRNMQNHWRAYMVADVDKNGHYDADKAEVPYSLDRIAQQYRDGEFTLDQYLGFYASFGFSLSMLKHLPEFETLYIDNPLDSTENR